MQQRPPSLSTAAAASARGASHKNAMHSSNRPLMILPGNIGLVRVLVVLLGMSLLVMVQLASKGYSYSYNVLLRVPEVPTDATTTISRTDNSLPGTLPPPLRRRLQEQKLLQFDILVPLSNRDDNLRQFAARLKPSLQAYKELTAHNTTRIDKFRLMTTRYSPEEKQSAEAFQRELSGISGLPLDQIVLVKPSSAFSRAHAVNMMLAWGACHAAECIVARMDVDMDVQPEFFLHAETSVRAGEAVYFPIVWSAYHPQSVELVQWHLDRQQYAKNEPRIVVGPYSEHRGHWRDYGTGMWAMAGPDAKIFRFNDEFQGWGGEDGDFYNRVKAQRTVIRNRETGLVHLWHPKQCTKGVTVFTDIQVEECHGSRYGEQGSELGRALLEKWLIQHPDQREIDEAPEAVKDATGNVGKPIWQA